jgi:hypothetical protein
MVVNMNITIFRDVKLCSLVHRYQKISEEHQNVGISLPSHMVLHSTVIFTELNYLLVYIYDHNITGYVQKWCHQTI